MLKHAKTLLKAISLGVVLSAPSGAAMASTDAEVSFKKDLVPLLKRRCAACHITGNEPGKMALVPKRAYEFIVDVDSVEVAGMKRVAPGDPEASYLFHKIAGTHLDVGGSGVRMPFHQGPLPEKDIEAFKLWIQQGAQNN